VSPSAQRTPDPYGCRSAFLPLLCIRRLHRSYLGFGMALIVGRAFSRCARWAQPVATARPFFPRCRAGASPPIGPTAVRPGGGLLSASIPTATRLVYGLVADGADLLPAVPLLDGHQALRLGRDDPPRRFALTENRLARSPTRACSTKSAAYRDFAPNFGRSQQEPTVLAGLAALPVLTAAPALLWGNGHSIPPHNLPRWVEGPDRPDPQPELKRLTSCVRAWCPDPISHRR